MNIRTSIIIAFILISISSFSQNEKIKWYTFEEVVALNKKTPKKVFIDMYTDWCGWCKKMDATTFSDYEVANYMNKNFYCVKFNAERSDTVNYGGQDFVNPNPGVRRSSHQLAVALLQGKMSYPSYIFLNEKMELLTTVPGYMDVLKFEPIIKYFGENAYLKQNDWTEYMNTFKSTFKYPKQ
ncbi:MAG: DUF255 domain-containing protein [Saprospiraceae bacterium]|nr:DUF255 domain-containing protein [Saprospiraceae bacterium]